MKKSLINPIKFKKAIPIWAKGRECEKNLTLVFSISLEIHENTMLNLSCSTSYQAYLNGKFISAGPARTCPKYFYVDEISLDLSKKKNELVIVVAGYNVNSYQYVNQSSFLIAEVVSCEKVLAFSEIQGDFRCRVGTERIQKLDQFSFQRAFVEVYELHKGGVLWEDNLGTSEEVQKLAEVDGGVYMKRPVPYPDYDVASVKVAGAGRGDLSQKQTNYVELIRDSPQLDRERYEAAEFTHRVFADLQRMQFSDIEKDGILSPILSEGEYQQFDFSTIKTGFLCAKIECDEKSEVHFLFDEIFVDGQVDSMRLGCLSDVKFVIEPGIYNVRSFEPYTMSALRVFVTKGKCKISNIFIQEFTFPKIENLKKYKDIDMQKIYDAAVATFRHNTLDIYMDCPSRERAGWLCDSFFMSRVEYLLTGKSVVERSFLLNFLLPDKFSNLPEGMLPMCYPADHADGTFIPNWAMWFVIQLEEYLERSGDEELIFAFKQRVYDLISYFDTFLNSDGLLEDLENWVFLEWSHANDESLVRGVNYPTNMTYAGVLKAVSNLYSDDELACRAEKMIEVIRGQSYNEDVGFFADNAMRIENQLVRTEDYTEVCQYYAFFFETATPKTHPKLWEVLVRYFGHQRQKKGLYPEIWLANAFIGNYLRLDILVRYGLFEQVKQEIVGYFLYMAERTGTLWENISETASCDHGFASHVICWLNAIEESGLIE